jgi:hypothetical protein
MKITATRTLMKSAPELWELIDHEPQLQHWSGRLCDCDGWVEVTDREPGQLIAWRSGADRPLKVKVKLEEKGFGTRVTIAAKGGAGLGRRALEEILEELAEPQRRPFTAV